MCLHTPWFVCQQQIQVTQLDLKVVMAILHENFSETSDKPASIG